MTKPRSKKATETRGSAAGRARRQKAGEPGRAVVPVPKAQRPRMVRPRIAAKESLETAFERMGGVAGLVQWGKKNPTEFYRIWARLLPKDVNLGATASLEDLLGRLASAGAEQAEPAEFHELTPEPAQ